MTIEYRQTPVRFVEHDDGTVTVELPDGWVDSGETRRDESMRRAEQAAPDEIKQAARDAVRWCYERFAEFTADDVLDRLASRGITLPEPRLLGPLMVAAANAGKIDRAICETCKSQMTRPSQRPERHAAPQYVWRSAR